MLTQKYTFVYLKVVIYYCKLIILRVMNPNEVMRFPDLLSSFVLNK